MLLLSIALAACGCQLRGLQNGNVELAISSVQISGDEKDPALLKLLRQRLQQAGVVETDDGTVADASLNIDSVAQSRRILSVNVAAKVAENELYYAVNYRISVANGASVQRSASARRDITFDENQVLAKAEEEQRLYDDMRSDVVNTMLRVLQRVELVP